MLEHYFFVPGGWIPRMAYYQKLPIFPIICHPLFIFKTLPLKPAYFFLFLLCLFAGTRTSAQPYQYVYYMDNNLNFAGKDNYTIIGKGYHDNSTFRLDCFSKTSGVLLVSASFTDSALGTLQGPFTTYYADAKAESRGNYASNDMDGNWLYWNKYGLITDSAIYSKGVRVANGHYDYFFRTTAYLNPSADALRQAGYTFLYHFEDSLKNTMTEKEITLSKGRERLNFEASFTGNRGLLKEYDSTGKVTATDSVFSRKLTEAKYPGGDAAWRSFLQRNLNATVLSDNKAPDGTYTVIIRFVVQPDGTLEDIEAENDPGYGTVKEAIRVISKSGKWESAIKYGGKRKAFRRQPITFFQDTRGN